MSVGRQQEGGGTALQTIVRRLFAPAEARAPAAIRDQFTIAQFVKLNAHIPELCLAIVLIATAAALALLGDLPWWQQLAPPAILIGGSAVLFMQHRARPPCTEADTARDLLRPIPYIAGGLGLVAGLWCVSAFTETEKYYCVVAPVFVSLAVLMVVHFLASVPNAAVIAAITTISPIAIKMLMFDNLGIRCIAIMMIIITTMQLRLIFQRFDESVDVMRLQNDLSALAATDPLTGLTNRRAFDAELETALASGEAVTVAMLDLDGFKPINDRRGHQAGDTVLVSVAERLRNCCPSARAIGRFGGDEFAVLFGHGVAPELAMREVEAARTVIGLPMAIDGDPASISASLGVATGRGSAHRLIHEADAALYADKASRRTGAIDRMAA